MTKRNSNLSESRATYSVKHSINLVFDKIGTIFFTVLCLIFLITSKFNSAFSQNISFAIVSISMPVVKFAALPFNSVINLLGNFQDLSYYSPSVFGGFLKITPIFFVTFLILVWKQHQSTAMQIWKLRNVLDAFAS